MLRAEITISEFERGNTIFVCNNLIAVRSCRKLVRIKLRHVNDWLEEETLATLVEKKPIGLHIVNNELTAVPFELLYDWNKSYTDLTKELYKELMDTELTYCKAGIAQEDRNKMFIDDSGDRVFNLDGLMSDTTNAVLTSPKVWISSDCDCGMTATVGSINKAELVTLADELNELKEKYNNMYGQSEGGKGMDLSERINKMLDGYKRMQGENIEKRKLAEVERAKEDDSMHEIVTTAKNKIVTMIEKMLKNKELSADEAKRFTRFYEMELNDLTYRADCEDIITDYTKEKIKQIQETACADHNDLENLIKEVRIRISIVETYEQAIEVLKLYDIVDENGAFIF